VELALGKRLREIVPGISPCQHDNNSLIGSLAELAESQCASGAGTDHVTLSGTNPAMLKHAASTIANLRVRLAATHSRETKRCNAILDTLTHA